MNAQTANSRHDSQPWWRFGIVWLVVGGPAIVVVAAIATGVIAFRTADVVVTDAPVKAEAGRVHSATPAELARNHAATAGR